MFKRSNKNFVSVLLPTRKRADRLVMAMDSLLSLAVDKEALEFILRIDSDDDESISVANKLGKLIPVKYLVAPRGQGYRELHNFYNDMAKLATGDWIMIFNDDAAMQTHGWDKILQNFDPSSHKSFQGNDAVCLVGTDDHVNHTGFQENDYNWAFPFVRRKIVDILGHLTCKSHVDYYLYELHRSLNAAVVLKDIKIKELSATMQDETQKQGRMTYDTSALNGFLNQPDVLEQRQKDMKILKKYILGQ